MKHIFTGFSLIGAFALLALAVGCTTTQTQSKENLLIAAGFKVIVPETAAQQQKLQVLPDVRPKNLDLGSLVAGLQADTASKSLRLLCRSNLAQ